MKTLARRLLLAGVTLLTSFASAFGQQNLPEPPMIVVAQPAPKTAPAPVVGAPQIIVESPAAPSRGYAIVDALIWTRSMTNGPLFVNNTTGATIIDTRSVMGFNWNAGPKVILGVGLGDGLSAEVGWFGFYDFRATGVSGPFNAATAGIAALPFKGTPLLMFDIGDTQRYDYRSRLTSAEFNVRKQVNENLSVLAGFRYINLAEKFNGDLIMANGVPFGNYGVRTENNLFGGQIGGDYSVALSDRLKLTGSGKIGIFGGAENQTTSGSFFSEGPPTIIIPPVGAVPVPPIVIPGPLGYAERRASGCQFGFLTEVGVNVSYQVSDRLTLRTGYHVMWIDGVALAPNQFTTSNFAPGGAGGIHTRGGIFMHGAVTGLEFKW